MKIFFLLTVTGALSLFLPACKQAELNQAYIERDSLHMVIDQRDSVIDNFIFSFNEVEKNLDSITVKQQVIYANSLKGRNREFKPGETDRINAEIKAINKLMDENRKTISGLTKKLRLSSHKNVQLEKTISTLNNQLARKLLELTTLNEQLSLSNTEVAQLKTSIDTLTIENDNKSKMIAEETAALHTVYYIIGQSKELEDANLIDRKGGLLGIGKTSKLNESFDANKFTRIDYTQTDNIAINGKEVKLITTHPAGSYILNKDAEEKDIITSLEITDPEKFWSVSKYLVIVKG